MHLSNSITIPTVLKPLPLALLFIFSAAGTAAPPSADNTVVSTKSGFVKGYVHDGTVQFRAIPYAQPPVGDLRWRAPQPVAKWQKTLDAKAFASACPQVTTFGTCAGPTSINEDCLYLNIFVSGKINPTEKKPVIVWIHGGGNIDGNAADYDPSWLAEGGSTGKPTVVVTLNYRLGLLGTLSQPALNKPNQYWGNYGILDQQLALKWVKENIAAFGGDPERITLGGQSAGALDTAAHMVSPLSKGLFHRAILQSTPAFAVNFTSPESALKKGKKFVEQTGCVGDDSAVAQCLRQLPVSRILQLQGSIAASGPLIITRPIIDGKIIPREPASAWADGNFNQVPVIAGATRDEYTFWVALSQYFAPKQQDVLTEKDYQNAIQKDAFCLFCSGAKMPADIEKHYVKDGDAGRYVDLYRRLNTDTVKCQEQEIMADMAKHIPVYAYDFTYTGAPVYFPLMPGFKADAMHTIDIQFLFKNFHGGNLGLNIDQTTGIPRELNQQERILADKLVSSWSQFAATGAPAKGAWPRFTAENKVYMEQALVSGIKSGEKFNADYQCHFWNSAHK